MHPALSHTATRHPHWLLSHQRFSHWCWKMLARFELKTIALHARNEEYTIKEYFNQSIGGVKKVILTFGPNGQSRGICTVIFSHPGAASEAANQLDGIKIDNRAMKVEVILSAKNAPAIPAPKKLAERVTMPNRSRPPTPVAKRLSVAEAAANVVRGEKKTVEQLDAEMADYFTAEDNGTAPMAPSSSVTAVAQVASSVNVFPKLSLRLVLRPSKAKKSARMVKKRVYKALPTKQMGPA